MAELIEKETWRQFSGLELIASEVSHTIIIAALLSKGFAGSACVREGLNEGKAEVDQRTSSGRSGREEEKNWPAEDRQGEEQPPS